MSTFKNNYLHSQVDSLRALPQPAQELKQAWPVWISCLGSCGCAALRQKFPLLDVLINIFLIYKKGILLVKVLYQFVFPLCTIL